MSSNIRNPKTIALLGFLGSMLINCSANAKNPKVDHFADNGWSNAVAVVQHPAGEYLNGITYVSYQGLLEDPYVALYNHETTEWLGPYKAGVSELGKNPNRKKKVDNHGKPAMIIDDEGYIHIVFGGHGGLPIHGKNHLGNYHDGRMKHVVSKRPLDISKWEELDNISPFGTYNQLVKMDNGDIYLFYRHGAHRSDWVYQKSTDNGRTFAEPVSFLKHKRRTDVEAVDSWYAWVTKGENDEIIVVYDYHICWDAAAEPNRNGHIAERHNAFYMVMDTKSTSWRNVKGETLTIPVEREQAEQKTLVVKTGEQWTFQGSVKLDPEGNPHITIRVGDYVSGKFSGPKNAEYFRWDGEKWVGNVNKKLPIANGDIMVKSENEVSLLLAHREGNNGLVSWWDSKDKGQTFTKGRELLRRPNSNFAITSIIRNAHPNAQVLVAERVRDTEKRRMYLLGENGPIQRDKKP